MSKQLLGKIPCEDCITISICKALVLNSDMKSSTDIIDVLYKLINKCSLIKTYMRLEDTDLMFKLFSSPHDVYIQHTLRYLSGYKEDNEQE